jgi:hypothetical protein
MQLSLLPWVPSRHWNQETDVSRDWETLYMGADRDGGMVGIGISVGLLALNFVMREPG